MLEPLNYLSCLLGPDWSLQADAGLTHVSGYWFACLEDDLCSLELRIHKEDVCKRALCASHYSDAGHASEIKRESTGGSIALVESTQAFREHCLTRVVRPSRP